MSNNQYLSYFVLGFADGLTVPFALTAGLSDLGNHRFVVTAGLAELFSGSISMGLGAYLAAITDKQRYQVESTKLETENEKSPAQQKQDVFEILSCYGVSKEKVEDFTNELSQDNTKLAQFIIDFHLKLERPRTREAFISAIVMGVAYFIGGLLPMIPYFATRHVITSLYISIGVTAVILVVFGYLKAKSVGCTVRQSLESALLTLGVGAAAAGASYGIVRGTQQIKTL